MGKTMRLDKFLVGAGIGSRREIKQFAKTGAIAVNNALVKDSSIHIDPGHDIVQVNGITVEFREFIYLLLNKPAGYVSATEDNRDKTVLELVPEDYSHFDLFPVGRLDKDTEGLLLLTNDGKLAHNLLSPKKHVPKTYYATIDGMVLPEHVSRFNEGVVLEDGYKTMPAKLEVLKSGETSEIELTIHEGKFHQVKRMFQAIGMTVTYLKRIKMGSLALKDNPTIGNVREMTAEELELIQE